MKDNTFIIPVVRTDLIDRCLETLYKNTPDNFYVIVVDQTLKGLDHNLRDKYKNLTLIRTPKTDIHYTGNLGFSKVNNFAFNLVETPYFTMCNDDVEFLHPKWWDGIMYTFDKLERVARDNEGINPPVMVNPSSFRFPGWSLGRQDDLDIIPYKESYSEEEYDHLVNDRHYLNDKLTLQPDSVIDGVTMYCSIFKTERFREVGLLNEKFFPGGGEDYDWNCRANMAGYRSVGTTSSWVFHHWSKSVGEKEREEIAAIQIPELNWNNNHELWGENFDVWGMKDPAFKVPPIEIRPL